LRKYRKRYEESLDVTEWEESLKVVVRIGLMEFEASG
jgi:hypothetical protein